MEELFGAIAASVALGIEAVAVAVIGFGAAEAVVRSVRPAARGEGSLMVKRTIWLSFARWLLLGLEFALAADIIRSTISPTWDDLGQLATIAGIRTVLSYFLERDVREAREAQAEDGVPPIRHGAPVRRSAGA